MRETWLHIVSLARSVPINSHFCPGFSDHVSVTIVSAPSAVTTVSAWFEPGAAFQFSVPPPLWRTGWALAFYILATTVAIAFTARLFFNRRLRRKLEALAAQQAMERERMRIAKDMHDEIGSKLTKISFMSERAQGELEGQESVAKKLFSIAHTSRDLLQTLDEIVWAVNPHNNRLEHLANYLGQYASEYLQNTNVDCGLHIPGGLPEHPFSAETRHNIFLAFEEALNNALKHGRATLVRVDMKFEPENFQIKIADNGTGFDSGKNKSARPRHNGVLQRAAHQRNGKTKMTRHLNRNDADAVRLERGLQPASMRALKRRERRAPPRNGWRRAALPIRSTESFHLKQIAGDDVRSRFLACRHDS